MNTPLCMKKHYHNKHHAHTTSRVRLTRIWSRESISKKNKRSKIIILKKKPRSVNWPSRRRSSRSRSVLSRSADASKDPLHAHAWVNEHLFPHRRVSKTYRPSLINQLTSHIHMWLNACHMREWMNTYFLMDGVSHTQWSPPGVGETLSFRN